jgi:hypothetical protein
VVARLELLLNVKKVVMKNLVWCSSMFCFSQRPRDEWLVIDSEMKGTATEGFEVLFE